MEAYLDNQPLGKYKNITIFIINKSISEKLKQSTVVTSYLQLPICRFLYFVSYLYSELVTSYLKLYILVFFLNIPVFLLNIKLVQ